MARVVMKEKELALNNKTKSSKKKVERQETKQKDKAKQVADFDEKEKIKKALIKKALGFVHSEVVEEYVFDEDGEIKISKRKVTKKFSPPDVPAVKILLEEFEQKQDFSHMTEQELEEEKNRLLKQLKDV